MKSCLILGISAYYHDSAAALLRDGRIVAAAQEERFSRVKGDSSFPHKAIAYCLDEAGVHENDLDHVIFYENPLVKFERLLTTYHLTAPRSIRSYLAAMPPWLTKNIWMERNIAGEMGIGKRVSFCDHHLSHAASAFFPSPFEEAAILTIDGVGEWSTATYGIGRGNKVELKRHFRFPNSLGLLYSAFTYFTGFKINSGEYKLMGLAPYGRPIYADTIRNELVSVEDDGSVRLNQKYFNYLGGLTMTGKAFERVFGGPPRKPETLITQREMDLAASVQEVLNEVVEKMARHVHDETGMKDLVLAGGVALNVVSCGRLSVNNPFDKLWIQPAAGDAGGALGAALWMWHSVLGNGRAPASQDSMEGAFLGPDIPPACDEHDAILRNLGGVWRTLPEVELQREMARMIADGKVVAIARGRMEWGPRALGARSILGDARNAVAHEHEDQVPGKFSTVRPHGVARRYWGLLRRPPGEPLHAAGLPRCRGEVASAHGGRKRTMGDRSSEGASLRRAGGHSRRLLRAYSDCRQRAQPLHPRSLAGLQGTDGVFRRHQHVLQRPG